MPKAIFAPDPAAAGEAAEEIGGPVALKAHGPEILHKTELGAVEVGLSGADRGRAGRDEDGPALAAAGASSGRASSSRRWSRAASSCWSGSPPTRSSARWSPAARAAPRSSCSATSRSGSARSAAATPAAMVGSLAIFPMLDGFRGAPAVDLAALEDLIAAGRRDGRRPPRDRRARPQPGHRRPRRGRRRRRPHKTPPVPGPPPLAQHLAMTAARDQAVRRRSSLGAGRRIRTSAGAFSQQPDEIVAGEAGLAGGASPGRRRGRTSSRSSRRSSAWR